MKNSLHIISNDNSPPKQLKISRRDATQALYDREWLQHPQQFNPLRNCIEQQRLDGAITLIQAHMDLKGKHAVDLGCGTGIFSRRLRDCGAMVTAVDVSANALKALEQSGNNDNITSHRDYVPRTLLDDSSFDLVAALDLIAYLDPQEFRLFFAELARLVKPNGFVLCSTPVDIDSDNALQRFASLAATELHIEQWSFTHNALLIHIRDFFLAPSRFLRAYKDLSYRNEALSKRFSLSHAWFRINSTLLPQCIWLPLHCLCIPILNLLDHNPLVIHFLAKITPTLCSNQGISHALFLATRKPLIKPSNSDSHPVERKQKQQVWE